jgi:hypothetical protein
MAVNGQGGSPLYNALNAASSGFRVFPNCPKTHKALVPNPLDVATDVPNEIVALWNRFPDAAVGMVAKKPPISATRFDYLDPASIPRREFLYGTHYCRQFVSTTVAPGGLGKSSLVIVESLAIASGKPLLGVQPAKRGRVWLWNGEDPLEELQRRIMAAALHYGLTAADFEDRLYVDTGRAMPIIIAAQTRDGAKIATPVVRAVTDTIEEHGIDVVSIDPFVASHQITENDNTAMEHVAKAWARIADETDSAIDLVHHCKKTYGAEVTVEDGRGASALLAAARSGRVLNGMNEDEGEKAGVENRRLYFRVDNGKANLAPPIDKADWHKLASVELGNGDNVGVVTSWEWPNPLDDVTVADLRAAQTAVAAGRWRENSQANDWVGKPIARALKLDPANKAHRTKIKGVLKIWMETGMFVCVSGLDAKRMEKTFVEVGEWASD